MKWHSKSTFHLWNQLCVGLPLHTAPYPHTQSCRSIDLQRSIHIIYLYSFTCVCLPICLSGLSGVASKSRSSWYFLGWFWTNALTSAFNGWWIECSNRKRLEKRKNGKSKRRGGNIRMKERTRHGAWMKQYYRHIHYVSIYISPSTFADALQGILLVWCLCLRRSVCPLPLRAF